MKIERVRIKSIDESLTFAPPSRSIEIRTDLGTIISPNRCVTSYEFNKKAIFPSETAFNNQASIFFKRLSGADIYDLLHTSKAFERQVNTIEKNDNQASYSFLHLPVFLIGEQSKKYGPPIDLVDSKMNEFITMIFDLQREAGHDIISIPHLNIELSRLKNLYKKINQDAEKLQKQIVFTIDMNYTYFIDILDYITDNLQSNFINIIHRPFRSKRMNYIHLKKFARKDIVFFMSHVDRLDTYNNNISTMHYMPFLGNDFYAVETPIPFPQKNNIENIKNLFIGNTQNLKIFNKSDMTINPLQEKKISADTIIDDLGTPNDNSIREKLLHIDQARNDRTKYNNLNALTRIHEVRTSTKEFSIMTKYISQRSSKDYVKSKTGMSKKISNIINIK